MKWLLTTGKDVDEARVAGWLRNWGCPSQAIPPAIPLGEDEKVFEVDGPSDLRDRAQECPGLRHVHRMSDPVPY